MYTYCLCVFIYTEKLFYNLFYLCKTLVIYKYLSLRIFVQRVYLFIVFYWIHIFVLVLIFIPTHDRGDFILYGSIFEFLCVLLYVWHDVFAFG